jgi:hypothetical protein
MRFPKIGTLVHGKVEDGNPEDRLALVVNCYASIYGEDGTVVVRYIRSGYEVQVPASEYLQYFEELDG